MTARRFAPHVAIGGLVYLVVLLATLPAPWVSRAIERAPGQIFELREPAGTAWKGNGRLYARQRSGGPLDLGALRWDASPSAILTGRLAANLALGDAPTAMRLEWSPGGVAMRALNLDLPARILASIVPELEALGPEGKVVIRSDSLRFERDAVLGLAEVEWRHVRLAPAQGLDLGSHVARLRAGGNTINIELGTLEGPLRLSGSGTWTRDAGLDVSAAAEPAAEREAALAPILKGLCSEYRNARCAFRFKH